MAGKHSDHYFCRWQAKIVTTINFVFEKMGKKRKLLRIFRLFASAISSGNDEAMKHQIVTLSHLG